MPATSDIAGSFGTWRDKVAFALFAAACLCVPGGLLLALAGRPGALWFAGACFAGFVLAENREAAAQRRLGAERHRRAP